jgi:hypothetical protein
MRKKILFASVIVFAIAGATRAQQTRWTEKDAADWYAKQPWLVGSNYIPANAINELEMWQADTFNPKRIDIELGWAEATGLNTMHVFLDDLPWQKDAAGFIRILGLPSRSRAKVKVEVTR